MGIDTYSMNDKQAKCSECGKFMSWDRSIVVERGDGFPVPSPIYIEIGMCVKCEKVIQEELDYMNRQVV